MKRMSIKTSILIPSLVALIVGIAVIIAIVGVTSSNIAIDLTDRLMNTTVNSKVAEFHSIVDVMYPLGAVTAKMVSEFMDGEYLDAVEDRRGHVIDLLKDALESNEDIFGTWTCWEPNEFDGMDSQFADTLFYDKTGRFVPYVYKSGNTSDVEALVDYDDPVNGAYYQGPLKSGKTFMTEPYAYEVGGATKYIATISFPIFRNNRAVGAVGVDIVLDKFIERMNASSILDDGYVLALSAGGIIASHPDKSFIMKNYKTTWLNEYKTEIDKLLTREGSCNIMAYSDSQKSNMSFLGYSFKVANTDSCWMLAGIVPEKTVRAASNELLELIIAVGAALIVIVGAIIYFVVRRALIKLPVMGAMAEAIAKGDVNLSNVDFGTERTKNEIALVGRAFAAMTTDIKEQSDVLANIAEGNYAVTIPVRCDADIANIAINRILDRTNNTMNEIRSSVDYVSNSAKEVASTAESIATGATQMAKGAQSLADGAAKQSAYVDELSNSIANIAEKTKVNTDMAGQAAKLADTIITKAEKGSRQMDEMIAAVNEITEASKSVNMIINTINGIAAQTNLLSLNAAIEAARAGEHGRGFAVVADEVRNLAAQSEKAAKETHSIIQTSIEKAELGVRIVGETAASLAEIIAGINDSGQLNIKIAKASKDQSEGITQIKANVSQVAEIIQSNTVVAKENAEASERSAAAAEESAAASEEMSAQANILESLIAQFKLRKNSDKRAADDETHEVPRQLMPRTSTKRNA